MSDPRAELTIIVGGVLVEVVREVGAELVVVGRRGSDFITRTLLGSCSRS